MGADLSVENPNGRALRLAASLLRACGGTTAYLQVPPAVGDQNDTGQIGLDAPNLQLLPLSPAVFHKIRNTLNADQQQVYELRVSADAIQAQVAALQLSSAAMLFAMASGVVVSGKLFMIEAVSPLEDQGVVYLYRLALRDAAGNWPYQSSAS